MYVITASFIHNYFAVFIIYVSTGSSSINTVTVWPRSPAGVNPTMLFVHAICARHLRGARIFFSKPLPIGLEMGWDPRIFGLPQIGAEMGRKCRILHRNKKYKKDIKIQLVSQWVCSMSFKITKVKLLFLGWFLFFLFICLGSEEYLTSHGRAAENMTKMIKKNHIFRSHYYWHF